MSVRPSQDRGVAVDGTEHALSGDGREAWRGWMRDLAQNLRRLREFAGLSREQLARMAGVSHASICRLEMSQGLATPLVTVLKINHVIVQELSKLTEVVELDADLLRTLDQPEALRSPERELRPDATTLVSDPRFGDLVRLYRNTPERLRDGLLVIMRAAVAGLKD
jgi:transcriptional regulator with XRE-family HTH domain